MVSIRKREFIEGTDYMEPGVCCMGMEVENVYNRDSDAEISALARKVTESRYTDCRAMEMLAEKCLRSEKEGLREPGLRAYLLHYGDKSGCQTGLSIAELMTDEDLAASALMRYASAMPVPGNGDIGLYLDHEDEVEDCIPEILALAAEGPCDEIFPFFVYCLMTGTGMEADMELAAELALSDIDRRKGVADFHPLEDALIRYFGSEEEYDAWCAENNVEIGGWFEE